MAQPSSYSVLEVRPAKDSESSINNFVHFLASLQKSLGQSSFGLFSKSSPPISLEIACLNQTVYFIIACPTSLTSLIRSQLAAQYPSSVITPMQDYLQPWLNYGQPSLAQLQLSSPSYLPLNTVTDQDPDHLASILGVLSRLSPQQSAVIQILLTGSPKNWSAYAQKLIAPPTPQPDQPTPPPHPQKTLIEEKISHPVYQTDIRLVGISQDQSTSQQIVNQLASAFGIYARTDSNSLVLNQSSSSKTNQKLKQAIVSRSLFNNKELCLNFLEIASLFHLPDNRLSEIRNLAWGKTLKGEPPATLPVADHLTSEAKKNINFFARTEFKNKMSLFGIKKGQDRRRHMYILGKSGTGKTTLIANMAIADIHNGEGVAIVDPHGDLSEILLDYIPEDRINDVIYLDPSDKNQSFRLNPLHVEKEEHKELVVSSILSIFTKIWANVWSARMEYLLRNALITLIERPNATLLDIPRLFTDTKFRNKYLESVSDPVVVDFWKKEYDRYSERFQSEAVSPILNKVGRFTTSPTIRNIVGHPQSTVDLDELINQGKILILNLAQGRIGEDNAALLGAMFITQIQIAAMNRVDISEEQRKDFYLYVDEFQNFATVSFVKILSEARKFRLNLILANQYTAQLAEEIQKAIFGNAGTLCTFVVGADDANRLISELGDLYTQDDLVNLGRYQIISKLSIDGTISQPFPGYTLPLPDSANKNRDKVIAATKQRYYKPISDIPLVTQAEQYQQNQTRSHQPKSSQPKHPPKKKSPQSLPELNKIYSGTINNIRDYGLFVDFLPDTKGLVHISNIPKNLTKDLGQHFKKGDIIKVKLDHIDDKNRYSLTLVPDQPPSTS